MQINFLLSQADITWQRPIQQSRLLESRIVHEIKEDAFTVMSHLHCYCHHQLFTNIS